MMKVSARQREGVTILDLEGKITIGSGDLELRNAVQQAINDGTKKLLVNLGKVTTIDSSGVGELVSSYTTVKNRDAQLKLVNLPAKVQDVLTVTQLIKVFDTYETEDEAIRSFAS
jgi:anti-sigma B factor antagonist